MSNGTTTSNGTRTRKKALSGVTTRSLGGAGGLGSMSSTSQSASGKPQKVNFQLNQTPPHMQPTPQAAAQANNAAFPSTDNSPYHNLYNGRQYYQKQNLTVSQAMAAMDYIDPNPVGGSLYSASQNLNHAMMNGHRLTAQQQYMMNMMNSAMHNLGYNTNLTRYDHASFANALLKGTGLNMNTASVAQLQKALVGGTFTENRFLSTSYNNFKLAPANDPFRDRQVKITYRAKAGVQAFMPGDTYDRNGNKLSWGEIIIAPNMPQKIVSVSEVSAKGARPKGTPSGTKGARQIEIVIELG